MEWGFQNFQNKEFHDTTLALFQHALVLGLICLYNVNDSVMVASGPWQAFFLKQEDMHVPIQWRFVDVLAYHMSSHMVTVFTRLLLSTKSTGFLKGQNYGGAVNR